MDIGCGLRLDYRLRLWAPTFAMHAISALAELFIFLTHLLCGSTPCLYTEIKLLEI